MNVYVVMSGLVEDGVDNLTYVEGVFYKLTDAVNYVRANNCESAKDEDGETYSSYGKDVWFNSAEYYEIIETEIK